MKESHVHSHVYVYYQVHKKDVAVLHAHVRALQTLLSQKHGSIFSLRRRMNAHTHAGNDVEETWMEVYENVAREFIGELATAVEQVSLMQWIVGPRHVEVFEAIE